MYVYIFEPKLVEASGGAGRVSFQEISWKVFKSSKGCLINPVAHICGRSM